MYLLLCLGPRIMTSGLNHQVGQVLMATLSFYPSLLGQVPMVLNLISSHRVLVK
jgi:hypothetical protein